MEPASKHKKGDKVGEYILEERLGTGGFGEVWKASHPVLSGEMAAVKIPTDPAFIENLKREGVILAGLAGEHIVEIKGLDPCANPPYMTMEYVSGKSLRQILSERKKLPVRDAVDILLQALDGLAFAHGRNVVHHDIKPENILLTEAGVVKLADFGLGRALEATASLMLQSGSLRTAAGSGITGTLRYMAPEQREGAKGDFRSDLYSLGVVFFEMITGEFPQGAELPTEVDPALPKWTDAVFQKCYTRFEKRYPSAKAMAEDVSGMANARIVYLDVPSVNPGALPRPVAAARPSRKPAARLEPAFGPPRSPWLWPFYFLYLAFHIPARLLQEIIGFLSSDNPGKSSVAPFFILFLGLFGISLLGSIALKDRWIPASARSGSEAPSLRETGELTVKDLLPLLESPQWRIPAREELLRRGGSALDELNAAYLGVRAKSPKLEKELLSIIDEISAGIHSERGRQGQERR